MIRSADVLPPGIEVNPLGHREYSYIAPGMPEHLRVTTDAAYYEQHSDSVEPWSPGNPLFPSPDDTVDETSQAKTLAALLSLRNKG